MSIRHPLLCTLSSSSSYPDPDADQQLYSMVSSIPPSALQVTDADESEVFPDPTAESSSRIMLKLE